MTRPSQGRRPFAPAIARAVRLGAIAAAVAVVGTVALAQPSWEPTVTAEQAPAKSPPAAMAVPKPKAAPVPAPVVETAKVPAVQPDPKAVAAKAAPLAGARKGDTPPSETSTAGAYCVNIASAAADARFAWQKKTIAGLEEEIAKRIALLEEKTAEFQKWLARREEFTTKANETVLRIYARMRPDAAAAQLAALDEETAAAVLTKLEPRAASLILNDMDPVQAVRLTATISASGRVAAAKEPGKEVKQ